MKKILTIAFILFFGTAGAQTLGSAVNCGGKTYYVRTTFTGIYVPAHDISTTTCPDNTVHNDTEEGDYMECKMELFADAAYTQPLDVDPRFFSYAPSVPGSVGTADNPGVIYRYECPAPLPAGSTWGGNWRTDRSVIYVQQCIWECVGSGYYNCYPSGPGMPLNYNIIINCCYAPSVLAVRLVSFEGVRKGSGVNVLSWNLENKSDFSRLELERSFDGVQYSVVYATSDVNIASYGDAVDETSYYRLRVYSTNGSSYYSSVVVLKVLTGLKKTFLVSPSPFVRELRVKVTAVVGSRAVFRLVSVDGREVFRSSQDVVAGSNAFVFDIPVVAKGIYLFTMSDRDGTVAKKLIKE